MVVALLLQYLVYVSQGHSVLDYLPGWSVESTIFFAFHRSSFMAGICPSLYCVSMNFEFSSVSLEMNNVLPVLLV
jgi:hypothetical protein